MAFNTSTRKDDVSIKYRALNFHKARDETEALEAESRKMEERLQELRLAMTREKHEREQAHSGSIWGAGGEGALGAGYTQSVLKKHKGERAKKVKILKEEPILAPPRNRGPGTMAYIAQRGTSGKENKIKGPKCGQCEAKGAQVSCLECGEEYCAGCFASFHLRGNLKKHRSVPVGSRGPRTPRGNLTPRTTTTTLRSPISTVNSQMSPLSENKSYSPEGSPVQNGSHDMLQGDYDEAESAASFQAALKAWRGEDAKPAQRKTIAPVRPHVASTEHGTSTENVITQTPKLNFHSSLSYAERLLLKAHRRNELQALPGEHRLVSENRSRSDAYSPTEQVRTSRSVEDRPEETLVEYLQDPELEEEEGLKWRDMHHAMKSDSRMMEEFRSDSRVSIIELEDESPVKSKGRRRGPAIENTSAYQVSEIGKDEDLEILSARKQSAKSLTGKRSSPLKKSRELILSKPSSATMKIIDKTPPKPPVHKPMKANHNINPTELSIDSSKEMKQETVVRPKSSARPKSTRAQSSRSGQGRPQSRARSRAETRLALFGEGNLTKAPSEALREVARMTPRSDPVPFVPTMGEFFTFGTLQMTKDQILTPRNNKSNSQQLDGGIPKWKVSYNVYNMGPRSWKPEKSLQNEVSFDDATTTIHETSGYIRDFLVADGSDQTPETLTFSIADGVQYINQVIGQSNQVVSQSLDSPAPAESPRFSSRSSKVKSSQIPPQKTTESMSSQLTPRDSRPASRAVVVDGDDMSRYDDQEDLENEDEDALYQLEWELASHDGRITDDGKMSRLSLAISPDDNHDSDLDLTPKVLTSDPQIEQMSPGASLDTRMNNLMDDFEEMEERLRDEEEVKALH